jgi:hypothetical protein
MSDAKKDYSYVSRKRGKDTVYKIANAKGLLDFAKENGYNTETFKTKFLRKHAMSTLDVAGEGTIKDEANNDVYIVGWRLVDMESAIEETE